MSRPRIGLLPLGTSPASVASALPQGSDSEARPYRGQAPSASRGGFASPPGAPISAPRIAMPSATKIALRVDGRMWPAPPVTVRCRGPLRGTGSDRRAAQSISASPTREPPQVEATAVMAPAVEPAAPAHAAMPAVVAKPATTGITRAGAATAPTASRRRRRCRRRGSRRRSSIAAHAAPRPRHR